MPRTGDQQSVRSFVGLTGPAIVEGLLELLPDVVAVRVFEYEPPIETQKRIEASAAEEKILKQALRLRQEFNYPFWDAVMLSCYEIDEEPSQLLDAAQLHRSHKAAERDEGRYEVLAGDLRRMVLPDATDPTTVLALASWVRLKSGERRHIPMLDFRCPTSPRNQVLVTGITKRLLPDGALVVNSGFSYHAYGRGVVTDDDLRSFLAHALLFTPAIDRSYIAHQLLEGRCALRISSGGRHHVEPRVIDAF